MKRCPQCGQQFGVEYDYCLNDGTHLVDEFRVEVPATVRIPDELQTRAFATPQSVSAIPEGNANVILYLIIGFLAAALIAVGMYALFIRDGGPKPDAAAGLSTITDTNDNVPATPAAIVGTKPTPTPTTQPTTGATPVGTPLPPLPPPAERAVTPNGGYGGQLAYGTGSVFSARAELTTSDNGQVRGRIVWTLLRTNNSAKMGKVGVSATEFVQGTYDPASRTLTLGGYSKSDAADLIILDKYRLTMSPDGRRLDGYSYGSRNRGRFSISR